jgi:hypothetical protein
MEAIGDAQAATIARPFRPESSASTRSKFSPQSSNSSTNVPYRNRGGARDGERAQDNDCCESIGTSFLQELLRERKASRLIDKPRSVDLDVSAKVRSGPRSSPVRNVSSSRTGRERDGRPSSRGERAAGRKPMGVKEMEEVGMITVCAKGFN